MELRIRKAGDGDVDKVTELYDSVNEYLEAHENYPGWEKGFYPAREDAVRGIGEENLFVAEKEGKIVGTFILKHQPEKAYEQATWQKELCYDKIYVIYTLAVHPAYSGQHIGSQMLQFIENYAKEMGMQAIRLDVVDRNIPAIRLYEKHQFQYIATVDLGLESIGLKWFRLYEKLIGEME